MTPLMVLPGAFRAPYGDGSLSCGDKELRRRYVRRIVGVLGWAFLYAAMRICFAQARKNAANAPSDMDAFSLIKSRVESDHVAPRTVRAHGSQIVGCSV